MVRLKTNFRITEVGMQENPIYKTADGASGDIFRRARKAVGEPICLRQ